MADPFMQWFAALVRADDSRPVDQQIKEQIYDAVMKELKRNALSDEAADPTGGRA